MEFNLSRALIQGGRVNDLASDVRSSKNSLNVVKESLGSSWKAAEMTYINNHFGKLATEVSKLVSELESIGHDIQSAANEIHKEVEAKKAAEAEVKAKAEAAAKVKVANQGV